MKGNKLFLCALLLLGGVKGFCQDPLYTQFYFNSIFTNPSLAGSNHHGTRFIANQRNQWHNIPGMLSTSTISVDMNFIRTSNIGIFIYEDFEGEQFLNQKGGYVNLSAYLDISRTLSFRWGGKIGLYEKQINWDKFVFYDQLDPFYGNIAQSNIPYAIESTGGILDASFGLSLFYSPKKGGKDGIYMLGLTGEHIYCKEETFYDGKYQLPFISTFHLTSLIPTKYKSDILYNPYFRWTRDWAKNIDYKYISSENQFQNVDFGLNLFVGSLTFGMGGKYIKYKNPSKNINHLAFVIGWTNTLKNFMVSFSQDIPSPGFLSTTFTTSELNLILFLDGSIFPQKGVYNKSGGSGKCSEFYRRGKTVPVF